MTAAGMLLRAGFRRYWRSWLVLALLVTCARLSLRGELYGKARSYLETSYALAPNPQTAQLLAELLEQLGEPQEAYEAYRHALAVISAGGRSGLRNADGDEEALAFEWAAAQGTAFIYQGQQFFVCIAGRAYSGDDLCFT